MAFRDEKIAEKAEKMSFKDALAARKLELLEKNEKEAKLIETHGQEELKAEMGALKDQLKKTEIELQKFQQATKESEVKKELDRLRKSPLDTLLLEAIENSELERLTHLLALGANINARNENGQTPLLLSMQGRQKEVVDYLMTKKPDLTVIDSKGNNLIENMAILANIEMLTLLIEHYSKAEGISFLMHAYNKTKELKTDEYVRVRKILADNMLKYSVKQGNLDEVVKALCDFRAEIDAQDASLETALHKAAYLSHLKIVDYLLESDSKTDVQDNHGQTAIKAASGENKDNIIRLIKHYELLRCVRKGDKEGLEKLITEYADQGLHNYYLSEEKNILVAALRMSRSIGNDKRLEIIQLLLKNGAGVNCSVGGSTPLHIAVSLDDKEAIKLLINAGAMKDNKGSGHRTVIEFARATGKSDLADYMLEKFAKVKTKLKHGIVSTSSFTQFGKAEGTKQKTSSSSEEVIKSTAALK